MLSVGGGNLEKNVSPNLVTALQYAQEVGTPVIGIVGKDGGYTAQGGRRLRDRADGQPRRTSRRTPRRSRRWSGTCSSRTRGSRRRQTKWESVR